MGQWPIDEDSNITVKGATWAIADLLDGSPYKDAFSGGIYTHLELEPAGIKINRNNDPSSLWLFGMTKNMRDRTNSGFLDSMSLRKD